MLCKLAAGLLLSIALVAGSAAAAPVTERVYFQCGAAKIANFDDRAAGWSTVAPAATVAEGGGCMQADAANHQGSVGPATATTGRFAGTFTGNLHSINVRLDTVSVGTVQLGDRAEFDITLRVDGHDALGGTRRLAVQPIPAAGGHGRVHTYFFSVVGLPYVEPLDNRRHTIEFSAEPVNQPAVGWAYGAKEVPSGLDFNPTGYHPYKVAPSR